MGKIENLKIDTHMLPISLLSLLLTTSLNTNIVHINRVSYDYVQIVQCLNQVPSNIISLS